MKKRNLVNLLRKNQVRNLIRNLVKKIHQKDPILTHVRIVVLTYLSKFKYSIG